MTKYRVNVRRVVREDTYVTVMAATKDDAVIEARLAATSVGADQWDCYDCEYYCDTVQETE